MESNDEISGLGKISINEDEITVEDIQIFNQEVSGAHTVLDKRELGKFYDKIIQEEGDLTNWKLWWHSHCNMESFFSSTDTDTIDDFDNETVADNWGLAIVGNHKMELMARLDIYSPMRITIPISKFIISYDDPEITEAVTNEILEKVSKPYSYFHNRNWNRQNKKRHKGRPFPYYPPPPDSGPSLDDDPLPYGDNDPGKALVNLVNKHKPMYNYKGREIPIKKVS